MKVEYSNLPPDVYQLATYLGGRLNCRYLVDIGRGGAESLGQFPQLFHVIRVVHSLDNNICYKRKQHQEYIEHNFNQVGSVPIEQDVIKQSVIICSELTPQLIQSTYLLENLKLWLEHAALCVLSGSVELFRAEGWDLPDFVRALRARGLNVAFTGRAMKNGNDTQRNNFVAVVGKKTGRAEVICYSTPRDFRVVAIMAVYNEEDILVDSLNQFIRQGIDVYIIDNWSNDASFDLAEKFLGDGLIGIERFPRSGPPKYFSLKEILTRKEELAKELRADWFINTDADEIRLPPWPGKSLRDGIYQVDREGFNCVDNTVIVFPPTDNNFSPGTSLQSHFKYFEFGKHFGDFVRINTWKNFGQQVWLADSGGHSVNFKNRRVYPFKFLTKHYMIRSQTHGEKKVLTERVNRYNPLEKAKGWHTHYKRIGETPHFLRDSSSLIPYDENQFYEEYLVERLTGVGALFTQVT